VSSRVALLFAGAALASAAVLADDRPPPRDPTQPYGRSAAVVAGVPNGPRFTLTAVLVSAERRVAVVNGKPYLQGDRVDGAEIVQIDANAVRLRDGSGDIVVPLGRNAAARPPRVQGENAQ
jgi:hypothetical protein